MRRGARTQVLTEDVAHALRTLPDLEAHRRAEAEEMAEGLELFCPGLQGHFFNRAGRSWPEADVTILELGVLACEGYRVPVDLVDPEDTSAWSAAIARASVVFIETPSNPLLKLLDVEKTARDGHAAGAQIIVDNTVATPFNQQPFRLGADWIVHSASKYLNGHSDMISGCLVNRHPLEAKHRDIHRILGGTVNALDAWLVLRGLRTFALRMEAHNRNGAVVADWLTKHPAVSRVYYPGFWDGTQAALLSKQMRGGGGLLSFELKGGVLASRRFIDRLQLIVHALSLGGMESMAVRPAATSHRALTPAIRQAAGVTDSLIRLSVGTEALVDILSDLEQALAYPTTNG